MDTVSDLMTPDPVKVVATATIGECAQILANHRFRHLLVVDEDGVLLGVVHDFEVFRRGFLTGGRVGSWMPIEPEDTNVPASDLAVEIDLLLGPDDELIPALGRLAHSPSDLIAVIDEQHHPIGILTEHDGVRLGQGLGSSARVREEAGDVLTVRESDTVDLAWGWMTAQGVRHLVVVSNEQRVVGVLSFRDLAVARSTGGARGPISEVWRGSEVFTVRPGASLARCAALMVEHTIGCLPIVDELNRPIGMVSRTDVIEAVVAGG